MKKLVAGQKKGCRLAVVKNTGGEEGLLLRESKTTAFYGVFFNFIFYFNNVILVTLYSKTTSFWVFHPF
jgi:hypothetical protein